MEDKLYNCITLFSIGIAIPTPCPYLDKRQIIEIMKQAIYVLMQDSSGKYIKQVLSVTFAEDESESTLYSFKIHYIAVENEYGATIAEIIDSIHRALKDGTYKYIIKMLEQKLDIYDNPLDYVVDKVHTEYWPVDNIDNKTYV